MRRDHQLSTSTTPASISKKQNESLKKSLAPNAFTATPQLASVVFCHRFSKDQVRPKNSN